MMQTEEEVEDFLAHHGILGMHWGIRKARSLSGDGHTKLTRKTQIHNAKIHQLERDPFAHEQYRSGETIALGRASTLAAIGTIGAGVFRLYGPNTPKVQLGARIVQGVLGGAAVGFTIAASRSTHTDLIKKYGK